MMLIQRKIDFLNGFWSDSAKRKLNVNNIEVKMETYILDAALKILLGTFFLTKDDGIHRFSGNSELSHLSYFMERSREME